MNAVSPIRLCLSFLKKKTVPQERSLMYCRRVHRIGPLLVNGCGKIKAHINWPMTLPE